MIRALWTAGTGMNVQQTNLDVIANNIANVNTNGFKRSRADFQDLMYQTLRLQGAQIRGRQYGTDRCSDRSRGHAGIGAEGVPAG